MVNQNQNQEASNQDWHRYFERIKIYCPWSWSAWCKDLIDIQQWYGEALPLGDFKARIYTHPRKPRLLKKIAEQQMMLYHSEEWLYSHPQYKRAGTPVPCLIQQDLAQLETARTHFNKNNQEEAQKAHNT